MAFNLEAARKAKKSDADIANYLGNQFGFNVDAARKAGKTDTQIAEYLSKNERPPAANEAEPPASFSTSKMVGNLPSSAGKFAEGMVQPVVAPVKTGTALANLASGAIVKGAESVGLPVSGERLAEEDVQTFNAVANFYKDRYGTFDGFKKALQDDPVGVAADLSTVLGGGGMAAKAGGLSKVSKVLSTASKFTDPVQLAAATVAAPIAGINKVVGAESKAAKARAIIAAGKAKGVDITLGEALKAPNLERAETLMERIPIIGTTGYREKVLGQTQQAIKKFAADYIANPKDATGTGNRAFVSGLYEDLKQVIEPVKNKTIAATETRKKAIDLLDRYPDLFKKFQDTKRESLISSIASDTAPITKEATITKSPLLDQWGKEVTHVTPGSTAPANVKFDDLWALRDGIGDMIGQAKKTLAQPGGVDKTVLSQLNGLYASINNDIDRWATTVGKPEIRTAINTANDAYKQFNVKFNIVNDAMAKSKTLVNGTEVFSPKQFSNALRKEIALQDKLERRGVKGMFKPAEIQEMTGMATLLDTVKRSGQFAENAATGDRWGFPAIVAGMTSVAGAKAGLATAGFAGFAKFLTTTDTGKKLALQAASIKPMSESMNKLGNKAMFLFQSGRAANEANNPNANRSDVNLPSLVSTAEAADGSTVGGNIAAGAVALNEGQKAITGLAQQGVNNIGRFVSDPVGYTKEATGNAVNQFAIPTKEMSYWDAEAQDYVSRKVIDESRLAELAPGTGIVGTISGKGAKGLGGMVSSINQNDELSRIIKRATPEEREEFVRLMSKISPGIKKFNPDEAVEAGKQLLREMDAKKRSAILEAVGLGASAAALVGGGLALGATTTKKKENHRSSPHPISAKN